MTKRSVTSEAAKLLARYSRARDASAVDEQKAAWTQRMVAIMEFTDILGIKRSKIVKLTVEAK